jgi:ABC-type amino acid transport substrate-binding protein
LLGISLIGVPNKQPLLDVLHVAIQAISRATRFVVKLTPAGIFAIAAHAAGTMSLDQLGRIEIYLVAYVAIVLLLSLWVLPALVSALTPIPLRDVFSANKDALLTAFVAGDIFIVLPSLVESCERTMQKYGIGSLEESRLSEVIVPASFNFPHTGKLLSLSFVLFAAWFSDTTLSWREYPQLAGAGLLSIFGSLNSAIPFLLDLFRIPADTFQLFLATGVINARFGSLLAAVHLIAVSLLGTAAIAGAIQVRPARILRFVVITTLMSAGTIGGLKWLFAYPLRPHFEGSARINHLAALLPAPNAQVVAADSPPLPQDPRGVYESIQAAGILRVCHVRNRIPLVFTNTAGELVGLEIESAQLLARELGVKAEFLPISVFEIEGALEAERCHIVMSGIALTPRRESRYLLSRTYLDETLGFAMLDHRREEFRDWRKIRQAGPVRLAVPDIPHYLQLIRDRLPEAKIAPVAADDITLDRKSDLDAYVIPAEAGAAMTLLMPEFSIVVPEPEPIRIPLAFPLARGDERWARVVNDWIELRQKDGTFDALYRHWILGQSSGPLQRRWSMLDQWIVPSITGGK